ncbi:MAG TPA: hypothetical protein ENJ43_02200 [Gammaproteobacteria bacterium]|nr:hypothetical protein [Gammaproteobacteria bacterium]
MKIDLETAAGYTIHSYSEREFVINVPPAMQAGPVGGGTPSGEPGQEILSHSLVVMPDRLLRDWPPGSLEQLTVEHLEMVARLDPELVLLGLGKRLRFPDPGLVAPLFRRNIGVEYMNTPAACRTYNFLASEGRRVAAAILIA